MKRNDAIAAVFLVKTLKIIWKFENVLFTLFTSSLHVLQILAPTVKLHCGIIQLYTLSYITIWPKCHKMGKSWIFFLSLIHLLYNLCLHVETMSLMSSWVINIWSFNMYSLFKIGTQLWRRLSCNNVWSFVPQKLAWMLLHRTAHCIPPTPTFPEIFHVRAF